MDEREYEQLKADVRALMTPGTLQNRGGIAAIEGLKVKARESGGPGRVLAWGELLDWLDACQEVLRRGVPTP